jgi:hypothetical protein
MGDCNHKQSSIDPGWSSGFAVDRFLNGYRVTTTGRASGAIRRPRAVCSVENEIIAVHLLGRASTNIRSFMQKLRSCANALAYDKQV